MTPQVIPDSSVAVKWVLPEPDSQQARELLEAYTRGELELTVPDLAFAEVGNILWKRSRFHGLSAADALAAVAAFSALSIPSVANRELLDDAVPLALTHQISVYDALFIALAQRLGGTLVTADERLVNVFGPSQDEVVLLKDWSL
ncbi:MAG: type II toxin-antitoxin system VapC family toxin [Armatimonadota bacterium]